MMPSTSSSPLRLVTLLPVLLLPALAPHAAGLGSLSFSSGSQNWMGPSTGDILNPSVANSIRRPNSYSMIRNQSYYGSSFFDGWDFWTLPDPTNGQVNYTDRNTALKKKLAYVDSRTKRAVIQVDSKTNLPSGANRNSVRIQSKIYWKKGQLVIVDMHRAPYGAGVWPAVWAWSPFTWPYGGEIDFFESVNERKQNQIALHVSPDGCKLAKPMLQRATGIVKKTDCFVGDDRSQYCGVFDNSKQSFGKPFNAAGGGVVAVRWDDGGITVWRFLRNKIPKDIKANRPTPSKWGYPVAHFDTKQCAMGTYFTLPLALTVDITLCGDFAGSPGTWAADGYKGKCSSRVPKGSNFANARFEFNYIKTFQ